MKVLILGGCGDMGSSAARDLIKHEAVSKVVLADNNPDMARTHESVRSSEKVTSQYIDVADINSVVKLMKEHDVVINDVGPYSKYGVQTVKAAIETRTNYVDICDVCDVTREYLQFDDAARDAGVAICTGFGGSPGITNLLAKYAADKLDEVEEIRILWTVSMNDRFGDMAMAQVLSQFIGNVVQYLDGKYVDVPAGTGAEEVDFWGGVRNEVYYSAHPEALTLPRYVQGVKTVVQKGGYFPNWATKLFLNFIEMGIVNKETLKVGDTTIPNRELMAMVVRNASGFWKKASELDYSPTNVVVKGKESGNRVTYTYYLRGRAAPGIGMLSSMCARMLCSGEITAKGIVAPEGAADPRKFLSYVLKRGIEEQKTIEGRQEF
ncbi:MAG: saccharopine dehydrogenase NADP-binding domain-containing protein [Burkholderiales bacterium]